MEFGTNSKKDDVIPAKAGIQNINKNNKLDLQLDSRFRGNDEFLIDVRLCQQPRALFRAPLVLHHTVVYPHAPT